MESLFLSLKVVFPLCVLMTLGYVLKRLMKLNEVTLKQTNQLVFKVFLPVMLFVNVYNSDLSADFSLSLLIYVMVTIIMCFLVLLFLIPKIEPDRRKSSVMIQGIYRSNYVLFGIPVTAAVYGADKIGMTTILAAVTVPLFNVLAVIVFEVFRGGKMNIKKTLSGIITNPLIIASFLGVVFLLFKIPVPTLAMDTIENIGGLATPLALIVLGATFEFKSMEKYRKQLTIAVLGKLVIVPGIFLMIGILLHFRTVNLVTLMALFASPTAVSSFTMADQMGGDGELAGEVVVLTSAFSVLTIFSWTYLLKFLQLV
jgi:predicted permease